MSGWHQASALSSSQKEIPRKKSNILGFFLNNLVAKGKDTASLEYLHTCWDVPSTVTSLHHSSASCLSEMPGRVSVPARAPLFPLHSGKRGGSACASALGLMSQSATSWVTEEDRCIKSSHREERCPGFCSLVRLSHSSLTGLSHGAPSCLWSVLQRAHSGGIESPHNSTLSPARLNTSQ